MTCEKQEQKIHAIVYHKSNVARTLYYNLATPLGGMDLS